MVPGAGGGIFINIMGVEFDNIKPPIYLDGTPIPGIIGYEILLDYLDQKITSQEKCVEQIQQRVRNYAKKQQTFWRSLQKELSAVSNVHKNLFEINLTLLDVDLYIKQLSVELKLD